MECNRGLECPKAHPEYLKAKKQQKLEKEKADKEKRAQAAHAATAKVAKDGENFFDIEEDAATDGEQYPRLVACLPVENPVYYVATPERLELSSGEGVLDTRDAPASCFSVAAGKMHAIKGGAIDSAATVSCGAPQTGPNAHVVRNGPYLRKMQMKMARGPPQKVDSCSLAFRTVTQEGKPFLLTTPQTPGIAAKDMESLVSLATLLEHGFECHLALPHEEHLSQCSICNHPRFQDLIKKPNWGGFIRAPESQGGHVIILEYTPERLWRLPVPGNVQVVKPRSNKPIDTSNAFEALSHLPENHAPTTNLVPQRQSPAVDHDRQQRKLLHLEEVQAATKELHESYGHFGPAITLATARYHGHHVPKSVATALRKYHCADCALGHGNRKPLRTKRIHADATSGASWPESVQETANILPEAGIDAADQAAQVFPDWGEKVHHTHLVCAKLPDVQQEMKVSHILAAMPAASVAGYQQSLPARNNLRLQPEEEEVCSATVPPLKRVRWNDDVNAMQATIDAALDADLGDFTSAGHTAEREEEFDEPTGAADDESAEDIPSARDTSEQDVGTDVRIDFADAISMGYNRENYYLLAVDKESDFLYSIPSVERANAYLLLKEYLNATGFRPLRLRCDNAPEFKSSDFVAFCESSRISIQYVESYNHTMNGRIENCVKIVKSHVRAALSASNVPRNFWPDCTKDLINKYNNLVKRTSTGQLLTPFERVKPKNLSNRLSDVFVPFGCKAVGILPKEHPLITNTSHQNRGYEGIFLCKHDHSEQVWLYVFALRKRMLFHDVHYFKRAFPFRNRGCLSNPKLLDPCLKDLEVSEADTGTSSVPTTRAKAAERADLAARGMRQISERDVPEQGDIDVSMRDDTPVRHDRPDTPGGEAFVTAPSTPSSPPRRLIIPEPILEPADSPDASSPIAAAASRLAQFDSGVASSNGGNARILHGRDVPLDHPWAELTWLQRGKALAHHEVTIPIPPGTLPGHDVPGIPLFGKAVRAYNGGPKKARVTFLELRIMPPHPRGGDIVPLRADLPGLNDVCSLAHALWSWKPNLTSLRDFGIREPTASDSTTAMLALLKATGMNHMANAWTAATHAPPEESENASSTSLQVDKFEPDPRNRNAMLRGPSRYVPHWKAAETDEMAGLKRRGCIERVDRRDLSAVDKVFQSRFHYKIKRHADGTLQKFKVRLVCQGQHMQKSIDYADAFSPVPHASGFRTLVALAAANDMEMDQVDISQAFIQGDLLPGDGRRGRVFIAPPPGYPEEENIVWLLKKPLYGMPQSARCWHLTMSKWLKDEGFHTVGYEKSMWCIEKDGQKIIMGSHIDDFIICSTSRDMLDDFRKRLLARFDGTYEGALDHYLGCEIKRDRPQKKAIITQAQYARHILESEGMWDCNPKLTPMVPNTRLSKLDQPAIVDPVLHKRYRGLVGKLGYLVNMTRPDLAWAYSQLSSFVQCPGEAHMAAAMHVLAYLRGTYDRCITYSRPSGARLNTLWGWVDSDWAADKDTRRSHTGYVLMLNGGAISWRSRRQDSVSLSTSEAEYIAASQCGQEVVYLREILRECLYEQTEETLIYEDNRACILMSENPVSREKSRHIEPIQRMVTDDDLPRHVDIRRCFLRELVGLKVLRMMPCSTQKMVADALTKSLPEPAFRLHRAEMLGEADMPYCAYLLHVMRPI